MKKIENMSQQELRGELRRHRNTLRFIASAFSGSLAQPYIQKARDAVDYEEKRAK